MRHLVILILAGFFLFISFCTKTDEVGAYFFGLKWPVHCLISHTFGPKCFFCGLAYSVNSMAHGHLRAAFKHNPAGVGVFIFAVFQIIYRIFALLKRPKKMSRAARKLQIVTIFIVAAMLILSYVFYFEGNGI